jgi:hypothetical protein
MIPKMSGFAQVYFQHPIGVAGAAPELCAGGESGWKIEISCPGRIIPDSENFRAILPPVEI